MAAVLVVTGCSTTRFAYERLDWLARWHAGQYVSFTQEQEGLFDARFAEFWNWHRRQQLPVWADELRAIAAKVGESGPVDRQRLAQMADRYSGLLREVTGQLSPIACAVGPHLSDRQTAELLAAVDDDIDEFRDEKVELSERKARERAEDAIEKHLGRWVGSLRKDQRRLIRAWNAERPGVAAAWLAYRRAWRAELEATLSARTAPDFCPRIDALIARGTELWTQEQQQLFAEDRERWLDLFAALLPSLDARQRRTAQERLGDLAKDLDALAGGSRTVTAEAPAEAPGA